MKTCSCGRVHMREQWHRLPFVGVSDLGGDRLDLRNCPCGSTICVELPDAASVCVACREYVTATKIASEAAGVLCEPCARACGLISNHVRRSAA